MGIVEGPCTIELQGKGLDVDAQNPARDAADVGGRGDGGGGDVVLRFNFFDGLEGWAC